MSGADIGEPADRARRAGTSAYRSAVDVILTGIVVIVPLVVTLFVPKAAFDFIANALRPAIQGASVGRPHRVRPATRAGRLPRDRRRRRERRRVQHDGHRPFILAVVVVGVGLLARVRYGERLIDFFDAVIAAIPGVGAIYGSFRRMGDAMLESSVDNFQEVVLVEYPHDEVYLLGFKSAETAIPIAAAADEGPMTTLFLPLASDPVMGGFLAHVPTDGCSRSR